MNYQLYILAAALFIGACNNEKQPADEGEPAKLPAQYYYYPKANVYFDSANKTYFFQSGDSLIWQSAEQIPAVVLALMDKSVLITDTQEPVWKANENHRLVYSAVLYATPNDTVAKKETAGVKKPNTATDADAMKEKKQRKGIGGFLDKIFGRKQKKKEDTGKKIGYSILKIQLLSSGNFL